MHLESLRSNRHFRPLLYQNHYQSVQKLPTNLLWENLLGGREMV